MKNISSDNWRKEGVPVNPTISVDDTRETVRTFIEKVLEAKMNGQKWVETTPEIMLHYNKSGLNGSKYFIYDGVFVCEKGHKDAILKDMNESIYKKNLGKDAYEINGK